MVDDGYDIYDIPSGKLQCEAPKIANLVHITPITMVYGTYITYNYSSGANLNQLITGGPQIVTKLWKITMLFMGKSTMNKWSFSIANCWFTRGYIYDI